MAMKIKISISKEDLLDDNKYYLFNNVSRSLYDEYSFFKKCKHSDNFIEIVLDINDLKLFCEELHTISFAIDNAVYIIYDDERIIK